MRRLEILAAGNKDQCPLDGFAVGFVARRPERIDQKCRVGQVRTLAVAVAGAAVIRVRSVLAFRFVPLNRLDERIRLLDQPVIAAVRIGFDETHHRQARFVVLVERIRLVDAARRLHTALQILQTAGDQRVARRSPVPQQRRRHQRRHPRSRLAAVRTVGVLARPQKLNRPRRHVLDVDAR